MDSSRSQARQRDGLSLYLHEASRERLFMLAEVLCTSKTAVIAQAVSRWALQASLCRDQKWDWYVEQPFQERASRQRRSPGTFKMTARLSPDVIRQVEAFAESLGVPFSVVVEQALIRWLHEDPVVKSGAEKRTNGASVMKEV